MNTKENNPMPKLISQEKLLKRYAAFSRAENETMSRTALIRWRKQRGFPEPVIKSPRLHWRMADVLKWEEEQGYSGIF